MGSCAVLPWRHDRGAADNSVRSRRTLTLRLNGLALLSLLLAFVGISRSGRRRSASAWRGAKQAMCCRLCSAIRCRARSSAWLWVSSHRSVCCSFSVCRVRREVDRSEGIQRGLAGARRRRARRAPGTAADAYPSRADAASRFSGSLAAVKLRSVRQNARNREANPGFSYSEARGRPLPINGLHPVPVDSPLNRHFPQRESAWPEPAAYAMLRTAERGHPALMAGNEPVTGAPPEPARRAFRCRTGTVDP